MGWVHAEEEASLAFIPRPGNPSMAPNGNHHSSENVPSWKVCGHGITDLKPSPDSAYYSITLDKSQMFINLGIFICEKK